ncbi:hypothetical protein B0H13DRAFT_1902949 [Mycena leptocephala]|nr:hypothetical protein B0H13DRAFT_1902949 [Mycena leptocephala]
MILRTNCCTMQDAWPLALNNNSVDSLFQPDLDRVCPFPLENAVQTRIHPSSLAVRKTSSHDAFQSRSDYVGRNNKKGQRRAVRLDEVGPRMELRLVKITEGPAVGPGPSVIHRGNLGEKRVRMVLVEIDTRIVQRGAWTIRRQDEIWVELHDAARGPKPRPKPREADGLAWLGPGGSPGSPGHCYQTWIFEKSK